MPPSLGLGLGLGLGPSLVGPSWWGYLEPSWGHLGAILGPLGGIWGYLGPSWSHLGAILGHLGPSWGHLGALFEPSWGHLGPSWGYLGPSWGRFATILGATLGPLRGLLWSGRACARVLCARPVSLLSARARIQKFARARRTHVDGGVCEEEGGVCEKERGVAFRK